MGLLIILPYSVKEHFESYYYHSRNQGYIYQAEEAIPVKPAQTSVYSRGHDGLGLETKSSLKDSTIGSVDHIADYIPHEIYGYRGQVERDVFGHLQFNECLKITRKGNYVARWGGVSNDGVRKFGIFNGQYLRSGHPSLDRVTHYYGDKWIKVNYGWLRSYPIEVRELFKAAEYSMFRKAINSLSVADLGSVLVELNEIKTMSLHIHKLLDSGIESLYRHLMKPVSRKSLNTTLKGVASEWLGYSFGVLPLLGTLDDLLSNFRRLTTEESTYRVQRSKTFPIATEVINTYLGTRSLGTGSWIDPGNGYAEGWHGTIDTIAGGTRVTRTCGLNQTVTVSGNLVGKSFTKITDVKLRLNQTYYLQADWKFALQQMGLNNPFTMVWEATRFSFILDWLLKVGDFLDNLSMFDLFTLVKVETSATLVYTSRDSRGGEFTTELLIRRANSLSQISPTEVRLYSAAPWAYNQLVMDTQARVDLGTGIQKLNMRAANAAALLVQLTSAFAEKSLPNLKNLSKRQLRLVKQLI